MALIVCVRRFQSAKTLDDITTSMELLGACLDIRGIRWLGTALSSDGLRSVCRYEAPDAECVRQLNREAGLPFESVWTAQELAP